MVFALLNKRRASPLRAERTLDVDGRVLPVQVREHDRATRLTLRIVPGGKALRVTTPPHVRDAEIDEFVSRNRNWVAARIARLPQTVVLGDGAELSYLGLQHRIERTNKLRGVVAAVERDGSRFLLVPGEAGQTGRKLHAFFRQQARTLLNEAVARHSASLGVRPKSIRITDSKSRWGSCSTTRTLSFSWRIVLAPPEVLDYLAAHEVAHLREMNHSKAFWNLVRQVCPQMERHKQWLRRHGATLHAVELS